MFYCSTKSTGVQPPMAIWHEGGLRDRNCVLSEDTRGEWGQRIQGETPPFYQNFIQIRTNEHSRCNGRGPNCAHGLFFMSFIMRLCLVKSHRDTSLAHRDTVWDLAPSTVWSSNDPTGIFRNLKPNGSINVAYPPRRPIKCQPSKPYPKNKNPSNYYFLNGKTKSLGFLVWPNVREKSSTRKGEYFTLKNIRQIIPRPYTFWTNYLYTPTRLGRSIARFVGTNGKLSYNGTNTDRFLSFAEPVPP